MRRAALLVFILIVLLHLKGCDQRNEPYKTATYFGYKVLPLNTDEKIQSSTTFHYAFVDTRTSLRGKLFVFFGGTSSLPQNYSLINKAATSLGYHVINLNYPNSVNEQACNEIADPACFSNYHEEVIFGGTQSNLVEVTAANSITNRILKLLQYLHQLNRYNGWDQFYEGSELMYSKLVLAGHSQGGGHAAYLAQKYSVDRVVLFSSPNDFSDGDSAAASWCSDEFATSLDRFYGLTHKRDDTFNISKQYAIWEDIGMLEVADTSSADSANYSSFSALVTNFDPDSDATRLPLYHNLTAQDYALPLGEDRKHLKQVWLYLLGDSDR
ncbi:MAG: hypothetical protein AABY93_18710 [Bacteroidota bacterium]